MDSYFVLADLAARSRLADTAFSALPDAPVQPVRARRAGVGRLLAGVRLAVRHRVAAPPRRRTRRECASTA